MSDVKISVHMPPEVYAEIRQVITSTIQTVLNEHAKKILSSPVQLTRKETAKKLRVSLPTIDKYVDEGLLKPSRLGRKYLFDQAEVDAFLLGPGRRRTA